MENPKKVKKTKRSYRTTNLENTYALNDEEIRILVNECLRDIAGPTEIVYLREILFDMVKNQTIPVKLLSYIPIAASEAGKTRFDQLYDAAMAYSFPGYSKETLQHLFGPDIDNGPKFHIWRIILSNKYPLSHVLIRAENYQNAFALGCDYACRLSLRLWGKIPFDLSIRVIYMGERALRRYLQLRWVNRTSKRRLLKLKGREVSPKQINGVRLCALGDPKNPQYSVARYCEKKDLDRIGKSKDKTRVSSVELESFKK